MKVKIEHDHKCKCIARAPAMHEGRDFWIGELVEKVPEHPHETHCLHLITPSKEVIFLCNLADFRNLIMICKAAAGTINDSWLELMVNAAKNMADK